MYLCHVSHSLLARAASKSSHLIPFLGSKGGFSCLTGTNTCPVYLMEGDPPKFPKVLTALEQPKILLAGKTIRESS